MNLSTATKSFPGELNSKFSDNINKKMWLYGFVIFAVVGALVGGLSFRKPNVELTSQDVLKIRERHARLELAKPKEEAPPPKNEEPAEKKEEEKKEEEKAEEKVEEKTPPPPGRNQPEAREVRKQETQAERLKARENLRDEISQSGLFAELTAAGDGDGGGDGVDDILALGKARDIADVELTVSKFVPQPKAPAKLEKRGERIQSTGLGQQKIEKAEVKQIEVVAEVKLAAPQKIEGLASGEESRSAKAIEKIIEGIQTNIKAQFEKYLRQDPSLSGKVEVEFVIKADGQVTGVRVSKSSLDHPTFERRLIGLIERLKFPPASSDITITYPFVFAASKA